MIRVSDLARHVTETGSHYFDRKTLRFFGDSMRNFRVAGPITIVTHSGDSVECYELQRKRAVKHGLCASAYFDVESFEKRNPRSEDACDRSFDVRLSGARYLGIAKHGSWECYHWQVTLVRGRSRYTCDYHLGLGHATDGKPNAPQLRDVLTSLQLDSQSGAFTYPNFVSEFGDDSLSKDTWRKCVKTHNRMSRFMGPDFEAFLTQQLEC